MKTKTDIMYCVPSYGFIALIPAGTPVIPAENLPEPCFWAEPWPNMGREAAAWDRNYGFLIWPEEIE